MSNILFTASILILLISPVCFAQDPMPVLSSRWERAVQRAPKSETVVGGPVREVTAEHRYFQRKAREAQTTMSVDPTEGTVDARRAAMERAVQESRAPKVDDMVGYSYVAEIRNDSGKTVEVVYWEYRFAEIARPANVVSRQFLCGGKLKDGDKRTLSAFTLLGPSDSIAVESLAKPKEKLFDEKVIVNRIEFADGSILQRKGWNFATVEAGVKRATSTPWGTDTCRAL